MQHILICKYQSAFLKAAKASLFLLITGIPRVLTGQAWAFLEILRNHCSPGSLEELLGFSIFQDQTLGKIGRSAVSLQHEIMLVLFC